MISVTSLFLSVVGGAFLVRWFLNRLQSEHGPLVLNRIMSFMMPNFHKSINFSSLSYFPLQIRDFEFVSKRARNSTQVRVKFDVMRVELNVINWINSNFTSTLVLVHITGLDFTLPNLRFKDILGGAGGSSKEKRNETVEPEDISPPAKKSILPSYVTKLWRRLTLSNFMNTLRIELKSSKFEATMSAVGHILRGEARFIVVTSYSSDMGEAIKAAVHGSTLEVSYFYGEARVGDGGVRKTAMHNVGASWMKYSSDLSEFVHDINSSTKLKDMGISLLGRAEMELEVHPFLELYKTYQNEEDNALEIKLLRGAAAGGTMRAMTFTADEMHITLLDDRCPDVQFLTLSSISAGFRKSGFDAGNANVKEMSIDLHQVTFPRYPEAFIKNIGAKKVTVIRGKEDNFIDIDEMVGSIGQVILPFVDASLLRWLFVLQDISDSLPSSRFSHLKDTHIDMKLDVVHFGAAVSKAENGLGSHRVFVRSVDTKVQMVRHANETSTAFDMTFSSLVLLPTFPQDALSDAYCALSVSPGAPEEQGMPSSSPLAETTPSSEDNVRVDMIWSFTDMTFAFDLSAKMVFRHMSSGLFSIEECLAKGGDVPSDLLSPAYMNTPQHDFPGVLGVSQLMEPAHMSVNWNEEQEITASLGQVELLVGVASLVRLLFSWNELMKFSARMTNDQKEVKDAATGAGVSASTRILRQHRRTVSHISNVSVGSNDSHGGSSAHDGHLFTEELYMLGGDPDNDFDGFRTQFSDAWYDEFPDENVEEVPKKTTVLLVKVEDLAVHLFNQSVDDRALEDTNKSLNICFSGFEYEINGLTTKYHWAAGVISAMNNLSTDLFVFDKSTATLTKPSEPGAASSTTFVSSGLCLNLAQGIDQHVVIQGLIEQYGCLMMTLSRPLVQQYGSTLPPSPSILKVDLNKFTLHISARYRGAMHNHLAKLNIEGMSLLMDSSAPSETVQANISSLDLPGKLKTYKYGGITGGVVKLSIDSLTFGFKPLDHTTLVIKRIFVHGLLYAFSLLHECVSERRIAFLCDPLRNAAGQLERVTSTTPAMRTLLVGVKSHVNVSADLRADLDDVDIALDPDLAEILLVTVHGLMEAINGPPHDDPYFLNWWDNISFIVHGSLCLRLSELQMVLALSHNDRVMTTSVEGRHVSLSLTRDEIAFQGDALLIDTEFREVRIPVMSPRHRSEDSGVTRARVTFMPTCHACLSMKRVASEPYNEHDVYIFPALAENCPDRFRYFRSQRRSVQCVLKVHCFDGKAEGANAEAGSGDPFLVLLRADMLGKIVAFYTDFVKDEEGSEMGDDDREVHTPTPSELKSGTPLFMPLYGNENDHKGGRDMDVSGLNSVTGLSSPGFGHDGRSLEYKPIELINTLDVAFRMDDMVCASWVAPTLFSGAATQQRFLSVNIRLVRGVDGASSDELQLDYLFAAAKQSHYYVRNWGVVDEHPFSTGLALGKDGARDPQSAEELQTLFEDVYKLASSEALEVTFMSNDRAARLRGKQRGRTFETTDAREGERSRLESNDFDMNAALDFDALDGTGNGNSFAQTLSDGPMFNSNGGVWGRSSSVTPVDSVSAISLMGIGTHLGPAPGAARSWNITVQDIRLLWTITLRDELWTFIDGIMRRDDAGVIAEIVEAGAAAAEAAAEHVAVTPLERRAEDAEGTAMSSALNAVEETPMRASLRSAHKVPVACSVRSHASTTSRMSAASTSASGTTATLKHFPRATGMTALSPWVMLDILDRRAGRKGLPNVNDGGEAHEHIFDGLSADARPSMKQGVNQSLVGTPCESPMRATEEGQRAISPSFGDGAATMPHAERSTASTPLSFQSDDITTATADTNNIDALQEVNDGDDADETRSSRPSSRRSSRAGTPDGFEDAEEDPSGRHTAGTNRHSTGTMALTLEQEADEKAHRKLLLGQTANHRRVSISERTSKAMSTGWKILSKTLRTGGVSDGHDDLASVTAAATEPAPPAATATTSSKPNETRAPSLATTVEDILQEEKRVRDPEYIHKRMSAPQLTGTLERTRREQDKLKRRSHARHSGTVRPSLRDAPILMNEIKKREGSIPDDKSKEPLGFDAFDADDKWGHDAHGPNTYTKDNDEKHDSGNSTEKRMNCNFHVSLNNMQFNFLDEQTHGSIILVANHAELQGVSDTTASVCVGESTSGDDDSAAMRRNEICLSMFEVGMYMASALGCPDSDDDDDMEPSYAGGHVGVRHVVHWFQHVGVGEEGVTPDFSHTNSIPDVNLVANDHLSEVIPNFRLGAQYTFYSNITVQDAQEMEVEYTKEDLQAAFKIEVPDVQLSVTSHEFNSIISVVQNVLLARPPTDNTLTTAMERMAARRKEIPSLGPKMPYRDKNGSINRDVLQTMVERWMDMEFRILGGTARSNEIFIGRGIWVLQGDDGDEDIMKVTFTGLYAVHSFHESECTSTILEVQRFSASTDNFNEEAERAFGGRKNASRVVSVVNDVELCSRCGMSFNIDTNHPRSCRIHADRHGWPGVFENGRWSCCCHTDPEDKGCQGRPHSNKEMMICVRAEAHPTAGVDNINVTALSSLNISIFPEANYILQVQLTRSLQQGLHKYFSIEEAKLQTEQKTFFESIGLSESFLGGGKDKDKNKGHHRDTSSVSIGSTGSLGSFDGPGITSPGIIQINGDEHDGCAPDKGRAGPAMLRTPIVSDEDNLTMNPLVGNGSIKRQWSNADEPFNANLERTMSDSKHRHRRSTSFGGLSRQDSYALGSASARATKDTTGTSSKGIGGGGIVRRTSHVASGIGGGTPARGHRRRDSGSGGSGTLATIAQRAKSRNSEENKKQEQLSGLFLRYVRVGCIRLRVALSGFYMIPLKKLSLALIEPFVDHDLNLMPGSWPNFLQKLETHAYSSLLQTTANSWAKQMRRFLLGRGKEEKLDQGQDEAKKRYILGSAPAKKS